MKNLQDELKAAKAKEAQLQAQLKTANEINDSTMKQLIWKVRRDRYCACV